MLAAAGGRRDQHANGWPTEGGEGQIGRKRGGRKDRGDDVRSGICVWWVGGWWVGNVESGMGDPA